VTRCAIKVEKYIFSGDAVALLRCFAMLHRILEMEVDAPLTDQIRGPSGTSTSDHELASSLLTSPNNAQIRFSYLMQPC
jgi:hypothetical protein